MSEEKKAGVETIHGLPMFTASDPEALAGEKSELVELENKSFGQR